MSLGRAFPLSILHMQIPTAFLGEVKAVDLVLRSSVCVPLCPPLESGGHGRREDLEGRVHAGLTLGYSPL